ncbi:hypothetical protein V3W47_15730 [Deinococcus sp. YIM 134068]|uniref:hypothetical protein n=1 Tax=Deinococcus lichenicola TaxID=3118910 RepID=UPI002F937287
MTQAEFSDADLHDLARVERYLILCLIVLFVCGAMLAGLPGLSWDAATFVGVLFLAARILSYFLYYFFLELAHVRFGWAYVLLALLPLLASWLGLPRTPLTSVLPILAWLMMVLHLSWINRTVFKPRGIRMGLLGPQV